MAIPGLTSRTSKRAAAVGAVAALALAGALQAGASSAVATAYGPHTPHDAGLQLGVVHAHGSKAARTRLAGDMLYNGGTVMTTAVTESIFWGPSWASSSFVGDKISGIDTWYTGFGGSNYAKTSDEYTGSNGQVSASTSYLGHVIDTSQASGGNRTSVILAEVAKEVTNPVPNGYYAVYVDLPRGGAGYCAWHSWGSIGTVPVQFAFFFNLDGDSGCDPQDSSGLHSQGLAALANVSGHELSEARTDPRGAGWFDSKGAENGDKCAWSFGAPLVKFSNGSQWKIQGEWSNHAFDTNTGYPNLSGQDGCLSGQ